MQNFMDGLKITGIGMGLVFLTLIIVMYLIKALDAAFPAKEEAPAPAKPAPALAVAAPATAAPAAPVADTDNVARAAVAGVAMALQQARERSVAVAATAVAAVGAGPVVYRGSWGSPKPWDDLAYEEEVDGETITVIDIEADSGTWKGTGRVSTLQ